MKKLKSTQNGYSAEKAKEYVDGKMILASVQDNIKYVYEDGKQTDDIEAYYIWVANAHQNPFKVKLTEKPDLSNLKIGDEIMFDNLQACEINYNVYFKADDFKAGGQ